ncbi:MAG TPA: thiol-disulfide oxidoreductase [Flavobacteriaceae bacterium]|jgi:predicted DCC family thiol-disulfide oxidoreductase YuxK|nr:thiol-disulfide oxidoreductase [Flavobacteriaceae bacterium]
MSATRVHRIVAFDGLCNLCNSTVNWIIDHDPKQQFKFIALQDIARLKTGNTEQQEAYALLKNELIDASSDLSSVLLIENGQLYKKSTAVLRICRQLSGLYPVLHTYIIIPRALRDLVYDLIAHNRYKWFGKREQCRVPSPDVKQRFL